MKYAAAIEEARELTARKGYDVRAFMFALNVGTGNDPAKVRRASAILAGLMDSPKPSDSERNSSTP